MTQQILSKIKEIKQLLIRLCLIYLVIGVAGFFIPVGILPKAGRRIHGRITESLPEQIGALNYIIVMLLICAIICGAMLHYNKYFDLKKDVLEQRKIKFSAVINKVIIGNNDFGKQIHKVWLSKNKYDIDKLFISSEIENSKLLSKGNEVELVLTANAYFPLKINSTNETEEGLNKQSIDVLLQKINRLKKK